MQNKELLKKAIINFGEYSACQCAVLNLLVDISVNNVVNVKVKYIETCTGVKAPTVYSALQTFMKDGLISKDTNNINAFVLNQEKLDYIVQLYKNKLSINNPPEENAPKDIMEVFKRGNVMSMLTEEELLKQLGDFIGNPSQLKLWLHNLEQLSKSSKDNDSKDKKQNTIQTAKDVSSVLSK